MFVETQNFASLLSHCHRMGVLINLPSHYHLFALRFIISDAKFCVSDATLRQNGNFDTHSRRTIIFLLSVP